MTAHRIPRALHPVAWWMWAIALAWCATRTTDILLLATIVAVVAFVVAARRPAVAWSRSFATYLRIGAFVIVVRVVFQMLFGARVPGDVLFTLPSVALPEWAAGVSLGGPVTVQALLGSFAQGLRLAAVIACFGAASSLASPSRLLRSLPGFLHEAGVAVTVAVSFAPQAAQSAARVREARRLRGLRDRGPRAWAASAMPVLESALDRAVALAASMDSRGYGRRGSVRNRRSSAVVLGIGAVALAVGAFAVLDPSTPGWMGYPVLVVAVALCGIAVVSGSRAGLRTRYRPDPWSISEWLVIASGIVAVIGVLAQSSIGDALSPDWYDLGAPTIPIVAIAAVVCAVTPAWSAPPVPGITTIARVDLGVAA